MRAKPVLVVGVVLLLAGGVAALVVSGRHPEWTTASPQALAELEKGLDASQKFYTAEASAHFAKAVELDANFVVARLFLLRSLDKSSTDTQVVALIAELQGADLGKLNPRERFLVNYAQAGHDKDVARAREILKAYAAKEPDDPYVLEAQANVAISRQDWEEAQRVESRLIEVAPNRVAAYNELGYLAMAQGRFSDSEKMFQTYRYIAPDQANPHDSLGELLTLIGRYPEAEREFEDALRVRPDFCASYQHLVQLDQLTGEFTKSATTLTRAKQAGACTDYVLKGMACSQAVWPPLLVGNSEGVWQASVASCPEAGDGDGTLKFHAALLTGRRTEALALEQKVKDELAKLPAAAPPPRLLQAQLLHMEAMILLADGKAAEAAERFQAADQKISYRGLGEGLFKLFNRLSRVRALQVAGATDAAQAALAEARAVNPKCVDTLAPLLRIAAGG